MQLLVLKAQAMLEPAGSPKAVQALANAAAVFEAVMRMEADDAHEAQARNIVPIVIPGSSTRAEAPPASLKSPPTSPKKSSAPAALPAASPATSPSKRAEVMRARKAVIEEQVAQLERQLAAVRGLELS